MINHILELLRIWRDGDIFLRFFGTQQSFNTVQESNQGCVLESKFQILLDIEK